MKSFQWPDWVPDPIRKEIERCSSYYGKYSHWVEAAQQNAAPEFGSIISLPRMSDDAWCTGKFVYAWGNIGRLVYDDGTFEYVYFSSSQDENMRQLFFREKETFHYEWEDFEGKLARSH